MTTGHTEGMLGAFANIYGDLFEFILARREGRTPSSLATPPLAAAGVATVKTVHAAARSASLGGAWVTI